MRKGNIEFKVEAATKRIVDDYDPYIGSVELSHDEYLGYSEITGFKAVEFTDTLDLTWASTADVIYLRRMNPEEFAPIDHILINIENMRCTTLPFKNMEFKQVELTVKHKDKIGIINSIKQIRNFKGLISTYPKNFSKINLEGFSGTMRSLLTSAAKKYKIPVSVIEEEKEKAGKTR